MYPACCVCVRLGQMTHPPSALGFLGEYVNVCLHLKDAWTERGKHTNMYMYVYLDMCMTLRPHRNLTSLFLCVCAQVGTERTMPLCRLHLASHLCAKHILGSCPQTCKPNLCRLRSPRCQENQGGGSYEKPDDRISVPGGPLRLQAREMPAWLATPGCVQHRRRVVSWHEEAPILCACSLLAGWGTWSILGHIG